MKTNRMAWVLLFLMLGISAAFQLLAQQSEADRKLFEQLKAAAEKGEPIGQLLLAGCYYLGDNGAPLDRSKAVFWFLKAADKGNDDAQLSLGHCYSSGDGITKDSVEAVKWYRSAAEQGNADAQYNLGLCYVNGTGVATNAAEGVKWHRKAAAQGSAEAQYLLGLTYLLGKGVASDYVEAYKWFSLSAAHGNEFAKSSLEKLEVHVMTQDQVAEGQRLAREFKLRKTPALRTDASRSEIIASRPEVSGSGFFISEDGYLISNNHVVEGASQVRLVTSAGFISAKVVKVDAANDLALLKAEGRFAALPVAASRGVKLGGTVATVGFPNIGLQGFAPKLAKGEIASLSGAGDDGRYFQISVPVQPGNSGGALVDERGNVVGVVSAKLNAGAALRSSGALPENVNYAVKSSYLLSFLESVPDVAAKLKEPNVKDVKFSDVVEQAKAAAVLVLVY